MTNSAPNRPANFVTTATTVVALLALASVVRAAPVAELGQLESRVTARESSVIRAVVVAVAAARDLFGVDQNHVAALGSLNASAIIPPRVIALLDDSRKQMTPSVALLNERLIDLPPPTA